jgi:hypothetical protein
MLQNTFTTVELFHVDGKTDEDKKQQAILYIWIHRQTDRQLTSCSAFICGSVVDKGSSSSCIYATFSIFVSVT